MQKQQRTREAESSGRPPTQNGPQRRRDPAVGMGLIFFFCFSPSGRRKLPLAKLNQRQFHLSQVQPCCLFDRQLVSFPRCTGMGGWEKKHRFKVNSSSRRFANVDSWQEVNPDAGYFPGSDPKFPTIRFLITVLFTYHPSQKSKEGHNFERRVSAHPSFGGKKKKKKIATSYFSSVLVAHARNSRTRASLLIDKVALICSLRQNRSLSRADTPTVARRPRGSVCQDS